MSLPADRPPARQAPTELLVLQDWEAFCGWFLEHTGRWPKSLRFTLTQRVQTHALDVLELLVQARYQRRHRLARLDDANLRLERMRFLLRLARQRAGMPRQGFERAAQAIDGVGRMLHGWRQHLRSESTHGATS